MRDEIEALLEQVETDNAGLEAKLAARKRAVELAEAKVDTERSALRTRVWALRSELELTEFYARQLRQSGNVPHSPPRLKRQSRQSLLRGLLIGAVMGGAAMLILPEVPDVALGVIVGASVLALWPLGDYCDELETRHG